MLCPKTLCPQDFESTQNITPNAQVITVCGYFERQPPPCTNVLCDNYNMNKMVCSNMSYIFRDLNDGAVNGG